MLALSGQAGSGPARQRRLAALGPERVVELVEQEGVATKVETTGKVFPASDRASDVLGALLRRLDLSGAQLALSERLIELAVLSGGFRLSTSQRELEARAVIVTTGGMSYPACGTTSDTWAQSYGDMKVSFKATLSGDVMRGTLEAFQAGAVVGGGSFELKKQP